MTHPEFNVLTQATNDIVTNFVNAVFTFMEENRDEITKQTRTLIESHGEMGNMPKNTLLGGTAEDRMMISFFGAAIDMAGQKIDALRQALEISNQLGIPWDKFMEMNAKMKKLVAEAEQRASTSS